MTLVKNSILSLIFICILSACGGGSDPEEPVVEPTDQADPTITITAPVANTEFLPGATIGLNFTLADDMDLESYSVDIAYKAVLPAVSTTPTLKAVPSYAKWNEDNIAKGSGLSGKTEVVTKDIVVPNENLEDGEKTGLDPEPGVYTITIKVIDQAKNTATKTIDIEILAAE